MLVMNIVLCYTEGDGCTYSCDTVRPIVWESCEAALVEFERACTVAFHERHDFMFAGFEFDPATFFHPVGERQEARFFAPDFLTVDEWFAQYGADAQ